MVRRRIVRTAPLPPVPNVQAPPPQTGGHFNRAFTSFANTFPLFHRHDNRLGWWAICFQNHRKAINRQWDTRTDVRASLRFGTTGATEVLDCEITTGTMLSVPGETLDIELYHYPKVPLTGFDAAKQDLSVIALPVPTPVDWRRVFYWPTAADLVAAGPFEFTVPPFARKLKVTAILGGGSDGFGTGDVVEFLDQGFTVKSALLAEQPAEGYLLSGYETHIEVTIASTFTGGYLQPEWTLAP